MPMYSGELNGQHGHLETSTINNPPDKNGRWTNGVRWVSGFWFNKPIHGKWIEVGGFPYHGADAHKTEPEAFEIAKQNGFKPDQDQELPNYFCVDPTPSK